MLPFFSRRILNIGNATGIGVGLLFFVLGLFFPGFLRFVIDSFKLNLIGKILVLCLSCLSGFILFLAILLSTFMVKALREQPSTTSTLVVLGCRVYGTRPSLMLIERLDAAYSYLSNFPEANCVLSGGRGEGEDITEAEAMFRYLKEKGIDEMRLFLEEKSVNTRENILFSMSLIEEKGLPTDISIVTNEFHIYRARRIAENLGVRSKALPAKTAWWLFPTFYVREMYSILYEWVR